MIVTLCDGEDDLGSVQLCATISIRAMGLDAVGDTVSILPATVQRSALAVCPSPHRVHPRVSDWCWCIVAQDVYPRRTFLGHRVLWMNQAYFGRNWPLLGWKGNMVLLSHGKTSPKPHQDYGQSQDVPLPRHGPGKPPFASHSACRNIYIGSVTSRLLRLLIHPVPHELFLALTYEQERNRAYQIAV